MTLPATARTTTPFLGDDSATSFPFTFKVFAKEDIAVLALISGVESTRVLDSDYSVALNLDQVASPGGTVTYPVSGAPLATGDTLTIAGALPYDQTLDLPPGGNFSAAAVENAFDRTVMQIQQLAGKADRALLFPITDSTDRALPSAATRANTSLAFDADGALTVLVPTSGSAADVLIRLADATDGNKGAALVAYNDALTYPAGSVGDALANGGNAADLANQTDAAKGAALVGLYDGRAPTYLKTVSDILNFEDISLLRFIPQNLHAGILAGTSITDIATYWQEAIDALSTGLDTVTGGTLKLHRGRWCISEKVIVRTGHVSGLASVSIVGDGMHNTQIYALTGFTGSSMLELLEPTYCKVAGLHLFGAYNAATGLHVMDGSQISVRDVFTQQNTGPGFQFTNNFMVTLEQLRVKTSTIGFNFLGPHTSVNAKNLYALDNSSAGYFITDMTYGHFDTCASDNNREGYLVQVAQGLKFTTCGAESCDRAGWHFEASAAANATSANCDGIGAAMEQCFGYNNNTAGGYASAIYTSQLDTSTLDVRVEGYKEVSTTGVSILMAGVTTNHVLRATEDCVFLGSVSGAALTCHRPDKRRGSATYNPPSLADGAGDTTTVTVTGVQFGDYCQASFSINLQGITVTAWVSGTDTVSVRFQNESGGVLDLGSGTLRVVVTPLA